MSKLPEIPSSGPIKDYHTKRSITAIKEIIEVREGRLGSKADKAVTYQDLVDLELIEETQIPK